MWQPQGVVVCHATRIPCLNMNMKGQDVAVESELRTKIWKRQGVHSTTPTLCLSSLVFKQGHPASLKMALWLLWPNDRHLVCGGLVRRCLVRWLLRNATWIRSVKLHRSCSLESLRFHVLDDFLTVWSPEVVKAVEAVEPSPLPLLFLQKSQINPTEFASILGWQHFGEVT